MRKRIFYVLMLILLSFGALGKIKMEGMVRYQINPLYPLFVNGPETWLRCGQFGVSYFF